MFSSWRRMVEHSFCHIILSYQGYGPNSGIWKWKYAFKCSLHFTKINYQYYYIIIYIQVNALYNYSSQIWIVPNGDIRSKDRWLRFERRQREALDLRLGINQDTIVLSQRSNIFEPSDNKLKHKDHYSIDCRPQTNEKNACKCFTLWSI